METAGYVTKAAGVRSSPPSRLILVQLQACVLGLNHQCLVSGIGSCRLPLPWAGIILPPALGSKLLRAMVVLQSKKKEVLLCPFGCFWVILCPHPLSQMILLCLTFKKKLYSTYFCLYVLVWMCVPCATKWCFWLDNALLLRSASRWEIRKRKSYMYINVNASPPLKMC